MEGRDERRPPWLSSDFVMMLVCGIILQLILTLDYGAIARVTKEVMQEVYAPVADASAATLVAASLARESAEAFVARHHEAAPALRCGAGELEASSSRVADFGPARVRVDARSTFRGIHGDEHYEWTYAVTLVNEGEATVQLLTRRWKFVDAKGFAQEVAGPGVRGDTPVLAPGETWTYESGTRMRTPTGSFFGGFAFEVLDVPEDDRAFRLPDSPPRIRAGDSFVAPVDRLALTTGASSAAPYEAACPPPDARVPCTAVNATRRVIVGVSTAANYDEDDGEDAAVRPHIYEVQINNARNHGVRLVFHRLQVFNGKGEPLDAYREQGEEVKIAAGGAYRFVRTIRSPAEGATFVGSFRAFLDDAREAVDVAIGPIALRYDCDN